MNKEVIIEHNNVIEVIPALAHMTFGDNFTNYHLEEYGTRNTGYDVVSGILNELPESKMTERLASLESYAFQIKKKTEGYIEIIDVNQPHDQSEGELFARLHPIRLQEEVERQVIVPIQPTSGFEPSVLGVAIDTFERFDIIETGFYSPEIIIVGGEPVVFIARQSTNESSKDTIIVDTFSVDLYSYFNQNVPFETILEDIKSDLGVYLNNAMPCGKNDTLRIGRREGILNQIWGKVFIRLNQIAGIGVNPCTGESIYDI